MRGRNEAGEYQGLQRCGDKDCEGGHPEQVRSVVSHILEDNLLCSVATVAPEGRAHVNTAYFCYSDDLELFFLSHPTAVHSQNVSRNASMAMTVFSSSQQWVGPDRGIQLFGTCSEAEGPHAVEAEELYRERFSPYANWKASRQSRTSPGSIVSIASWFATEDEANFGEAAFVSADVQRHSGG